MQARVDASMGDDRELECGYDFSFASVTTDPEFMEALCAMQREWLAHWSPRVGDWIQ